MSKKIYTVAILGIGARGADAYGELINNAKDRFDIVSLCDLRKERLERFSKHFGVPACACFDNEEEFFKEKRADLLLVATQDRDHVRHCLKGFALGYDIMTEKPLTDKKEECEALLKAQRKSGKKALVCHVLRYAPAFLKAAEYIDQGAIGKLVAINALERVEFAHQSHSYVRGNWRTTKEAAPMILAKCCHDLDLLQYYAKSKCRSVSSIGDLVHYKKENAPEGATKRCIDCPHIDTCVFSAKKHYLDKWKSVGCPENMWPFCVVASAPVTEEKLQEVLKTSPYGRCVYFCDNDVVDHQLTNIVFENGVKASLTMTAFTATGGRRYHFFGTAGELILEEADDTITLKPFGKESQIISLANLTENGYGHGGGDAGLINSLYAMLSGEASEVTSFDASVESHLMGICAEESRLKGGALIYLR